MAVAAFKSSSRRGASATPSPSSGMSTSGKDSRQGDDSPKKTVVRRSRSVSAFSRSTIADISADFSNSRDNPLFWSNASPPSDEVQFVNVKCEGISSGISAGISQSMSSGGVENTRGRSVLRNPDSSSKVSGSAKRGGRSLSRTGAEQRDRSVSRYPGSSQSFLNSESEAERDRRSMMKSSNRKTQNSVVRGRKEVGLVRSRSSSDMSQQSKGVRTRSSQLPPFDLTDDCNTSMSCNFEDRLSTTSSLSEAEEKTIKAFCEQMEAVKGDCLQGDTIISDIHDIIQFEVRRAIQDIHNDFVNATQNTANSIASSSVDIPPELVNPGAVELVMDLRSEYAKKLEQSQERARRLRADLAVEEHRGLELSRILREVIPAPKTTMRRKASLERRKMSKRLTNDALVYFDECVSLSTFDGSDFSSMEEAPPAHQVSSTSQMRDGNPQFQESTVGTLSAIEHDHVSPSIPIQSGDDRSPFSFTSKPHETQQGLDKYIKHCEKDTIRSQVVRYGDLNGINLQVPTESLLFDRLLFRNRIESGGLLLCGVRSATGSSYFSSII